MHRLSIITAIVCCAVSAFTASAQDAQPFFGEYEGVYSAVGRAEQPAKGIVVSEGPGLYRVLVSFQDEATPPRSHQIELHGNVAGSRVVFLTYSNGDGWNGSLQDGSLTIQRLNPHYGGSFALTRVVRTSPTLGQAAPEGGVVLLPYTPNAAPDLSAWTNPEWKAQDDGSMLVSSRKGPNLTKQEFGDMQLHVEFFIPHLPEEFGQGRGNSGIYIQNRYEVQVLDSFGLIEGAGDCGALYELAVPKENACLPPDSWQTYDITFHAPKFNAEGAVTEPAMITVVQNGITIHENQPIPAPTPGGIEPQVPTAPLLLQDHGNPVKYRNIWLVELNK